MLQHLKASGDSQQIILSSLALEDLARLRLASSAEAAASRLRLQAELVECLAEAAEDAADLCLDVHDALQPPWRRGDAYAVRTAARWLGHRSAKVRCAAITALAQLADRDDSVPAVVVRTALACLRYRGRSSKRLASSDVCADVLLVLARHARRGDAEAIEAAACMLGSDDDRVRRRALAALSALALPGDEAVVESAVFCTRHRNSGVRCDALCALRDYATGQDPAAAPAVAQCLADDDATVRRLAELVLIKLLADAQVQQKVRVVQVVAASLRTCKLTDCVANLLAHIAETGGPEAVEAIDEHLGPGYLRLLAAVPKLADSRLSSQDTEEPDSSSASDSNRADSWDFDSDTLGFSDAC